jgi:hypothetical protein
LGLIRAKKKLDDKYIRLFRVIRVVNNVAYTLELPESMRIYLTFHVSLLELYIEATLTTREQLKGHDLSLEGDDIYEVDRIKDYREREGGG